MTRRVRATLRTRTLALIVGTMMLLNVSSCSDPEQLTVLIVAVNSDLPSEAMDSITIRVAGFGDHPDAKARLGKGQPPLPRTIGLVHRGGPLGPIMVTAFGKLGSDTPVVERSARVSFQRDRVMLVRLNLLHKCIALQAECSPDQTCGDEGCRSIEIMPGELEPWTGKLPDALYPLAPGSDGGQPPPDASMRDADMDADVGHDAGTDADVGSDASGDASALVCGDDMMACESGEALVCRSVQTNPDHCGACDHACPAVGFMHVASRLCLKGECIVTCESGWEDRDDDPGCETGEFQYTPHNFGPDDDALEADKRAALEVNCNATFDSGTTAPPGPQELCGTTVMPYVTTQPADGSEVVVIPLISLDVASGERLRFVGERPVVLAIYGDAHIAGELDASGVGSTPGAGGNQACGESAGTPGESSGNDGGGGGGGGGFSSPGADGGAGGDALDGVLG
ncbi:MAG: hypothetical protein OXU20_41970, partial [Myxococcales bacterium]|nr:hypothetical protein [Myxococcales bacterium]